MYYLISLHNLLRWLILLGLLLIFIKFIFTYIQFKSRKFQEQELVGNSKAVLRKWFKIIGLVVNIQFLLGLFLYILNPNITNFWKFLKEKEIRFIMLEHPILMIFFVGLFHYISFRMKKVEYINQYKTVFILYVLSIIILFLGIPWFRPMIRY